MFNIFNSIKKITGINKKEVVQPAQEGNSKDKILNKIQVLSGFVNNKVQEAVEEYGVIKEKAKDLSKTNYNLGLRHLEKGNLSEAVFRFKIVKKFWPDNHEAYYQLAYCLILLNKFDKAEEVIRELLEKNPDYEEKIMKLLNTIDKAKQKLDEEKNLSKSALNNEDN